MLPSQQLITFLKRFSFFLVIFYCSNLNSQVQFYSFDESIGYSSNSFHIIQDDYGFLWSATLTGLVKTDGYQYTKFTTDRSDSTTLATNFSSYLFEDQFSNIWVNNYLHGLSIYYRSSDEFIRIPADTKSSLSCNYITNFHEHNDSTIYFSGNCGLQKVILNDENYRNLQFELFSIPDSMKIGNSTENHIWHINPISKDELLLSSVIGFYIFNMKSERFYNHNSIDWIPKGVGFSSWLDTLSNQIWIAVAGEPMRIVNLKSKSTKLLKNFTVHGGETYFFPKDSIAILFKENGGKLHIINRSTFEVSSYQAGPNSEISHRDRWSRRFCKTDDGTIFIASSDDSRFQHIPSRERQIEGIQLLDSKNNSTSCVYEDEEYFVSSFQAQGLYIQNKQSGQTAHFTASNSELSDNLIMHIVRLKNGDFLVLGKPHAYIFKPNKAKFQVLSTSIFFRNAIELNNGDLWLFPGGGNTVQSFRKLASDAYIEIPIRNSLDHIINVRSAIENKNGSIWLISATTGLYKLDSNYEIDQHWEANTSIENSLIGNSLESLFKDSKGRLWLGSLEGLSIFEEKTNTFTNFTRKNGLDDTSISDIIEDENGQIWVSTFDGLYTYEESENELKKIEKSSTINQHFSQRGLFKYKSKIYAAGKNGIDVIKTDPREQNIIPPKVQLVNIFSNEKKTSSNRNLETLSEINISPKHRNSKLQFSPIHYATSNSKELQFRSEKGNEWNNVASSRKIDLSLLPYGRQTLEVRASNADGIWSEPKIYSLNIQRPWYKTWWFSLLGLAAILGVIYAMYKWRLIQELKIQKQQLQIDRQIAEIELKALKAQMNPHFVFNSLNSVKALILQKKTDEAITYLTSFSNLIRKILNNSNDKFIRLQDEIDTVKLYLELESLRFDDAFSFDINIDDRISTDFVEIPALLLQPYIENAIWHGLLPKKEGKKELKISIQEINEAIEIIIEDNGIGRKASQQIKTRSKSKAKSLGMTINNQRIDLLKQLYGNEASIQIIDLIDEMNHASGTKVILRFNAQN